MRYVKPIFIFLWVTLVIPANIFSADDPFYNFRNLVMNDKGLSAEEKANWIESAEKEFYGKTFSFDYSRLVYGILSQAKFDEVDMEKAIRVARNSVIAVEKGAPNEEVSELALFAFSTDLFPDEILLYASVLKKCTDSGVAPYVAQEMIINSKKEGWPDSTFNRFMGGLIEAARQNFDTEKVALFMIVSIAQKLGTPDQIVKDALADAKKREGISPRKEPDIFPGPVLNNTPSATPKVALNYDTFRQSVTSFIGTPYRWGGNTRNGVDCSGFTKLVMQENGYIIPRVSRDQARVGMPVNESDLRLGDIVFFDTKGMGYITHVGLYLGGGLLAHASSSKGVIIVFLSDRYFQSRYISARRIVSYR